MLFKVMKTGKLVLPISLWIIPSDWSFLSGVQHQFFPSLFLPLIQKPKFQYSIVNFKKIASAIMYLVECLAHLSTKDKEDATDIRASNDTLYTWHVLQ